MEINKGKKKTEKSDEQRRGPAGAVTGEQVAARAAAEAAAAAAASATQGGTAGEGAPAPAQPGANQGPPQGTGEIKRGRGRPPGSRNIPRDESGAPAASSSSTRTHKGEKGSWRDGYPVGEVAPGMLTLQGAEWLESQGCPRGFLDAIWIPHTARVEAWIHLEGPIIDSLIALGPFVVVGAAKVTGGPVLGIGGGGGPSERPAGSRWRKPAADRPSWDDGNLKQTDEQRTAVEGMKGNPNAVLGIVNDRALSMDEIVKRFGLGFARMVHGARSQIDSMGPGAAAGFANMGGAPA